MAEDRKILLFRSNPDTAVDVKIAGSMIDEEYNKKIIQDRTSRGMEYHGYHIQTALEQVRQDRICVTIWACSYEFFDHSWVSDTKYDEVSKIVEKELSFDTDRKDLDKWFRKNFSAHTGQWIHKHPEIDYLKKRVRHMIWLKENYWGK